MTSRLKSAAGAVLSVGNPPGGAGIDVPEAITFSGRTAENQNPLLVPESAAVTGLPAAVGSGKGDASAARLVVAGAVGFAGVVGFVLHRPGRPLAANVQANRAARDAWQRRSAEVSAENARRRAAVRLAVHAGAISTSEQRAP